MVKKVWLLPLLAGCFPLHGLTVDQATTASGPKGPKTSLTVEQSALEFSGAERLVTRVVLARGFGVSGAASITASGLPPGITCPSITLAASDFSGVLACTSATAQTLASTLVTLTAVTNDDTATAVLPVSAVPTPRLALASPPTVKRGRSVSATLQVTRSGGFSGAVSVLASTSSHVVTPAASLSAGANSTALVVQGAGNADAATDATFTLIATTADGASTSADFTAHVLPRPGTLDKTFGVNGVVTTTLSSPIATVLDVVALSDGGFVIVGARGDVDDSQLEMYVARFDASGQPVLFGPNGTSYNYVTLNVPADHTQQYTGSHLVRTPNGSLVACGSRQQGGIDEPFLAKLEAGGVISSQATALLGNGDPTCGGLVALDDTYLFVVGGTNNHAVDATQYWTGVYWFTGLSATGPLYEQRMGPAGGVDERPRRAMRDSAGRIVVVGDSARADTFLDGYVSRSAVLSGTPIASGGPDLGFGSNGSVALHATDLAENDFFRAVVELSGGDLVAVGSSYDSTTTSTFATAIRLAASNGAYVSSFGSAGISKVGVNNENLRGNASIAGSDGGVIVAGSATVGGSRKPFFARVLDSGVVDAEYGASTGGINLLSTAVSEAEITKAVATSDGKVLLAGCTGMTTTAPATVPPFCDQVRKYDDLSTSQILLVRLFD